MLRACNGPYWLPPSGILVALTWLPISLAQLSRCGYTSVIILHFILVSSVLSPFDVSFKAKRISFYDDFVTWFPIKRRHTDARRQWTIPRWLRPINEDHYFLFYPPTVYEPATSVLFFSPAFQDEICRNRSQVRSTRASGFSPNQHCYNNNSLHFSVRRENDELRNSLSRQGIIIPTNSSTAANKSST